MSVAGQTADCWPAMLMVTRWLTPTKEAVVQVMPVCGVETKQARGSAVPEAVPYVAVKP